ncbi:helix-turn-helix domain-containing protein [Roseobacter sinensis]|uniref:Helix-turn-helix domain-containing protein n=1 Tax=Roseobacter sinensis TaxID=2931391 RepID=A0ABT3BEP4_9RHOB|nr:helix-turn-helix domain-containing protein [Roseobacter sp. WL0113]MCV3272022.1 helix-turn-helix domain-containing protein [Roseobacter sp. WL0113]
MSAATPFEVWNDDLAAICGSYFGVPNRGQDRVAGRVAVRAYGTLDVADISDDIDRIVRDRRGIRQDDAEHIFLVMQVDGRLGVDHNGQHTVLEAGDCILLDSTKEGTLQNLHDQRRILSFHLPRQSFLNERGAVPEIGGALTRGTLASRLLRRRLGQVLQGRGTTGRADLLFDLVHHAFARPGVGLKDMALESSAGRYALALEVMDLNLGYEALSLPWLAGQIGLSPRQLQRVFHDRGTSFREVLRAKRYRFVLEHLERLPSAHGNIAALAYEAGFRDLSNFNRGFRRRIGMTPRDYHARAHARMAQKSKISKTDRD